MPGTLLDWLAARFPAAKKQTLRRMAAGGRVSVNGRVVLRVNTPVGEGDRVTVLENPAPRREPDARHGSHAGRPAQARREAGPAVVYEDDDLLVVNKPAGLLTSTVPREWRPTLLAAVREYVAAADGRARVGLIHRLDRDACGLLVFSKNDPAYQSLKGQLFRREVERVYAAVVRGVPDPPKGRIESRLVERTDGTVHSTRQGGRGEHAVTDYEVVRSKGKVSLLTVTLRTGRKHQIRAHLKERGWPIVGDAVYGKEGEPPSVLLLAAVRLSLSHPRTGERKTFEIPLPSEFGAPFDTPPGVSP